MATKMEMADSASDFDPEYEAVDDGSATDDEDVQEMCVAVDEAVLKAFGSSEAGQAPKREFRRRKLYEALKEEFCPRMVNRRMLLQTPWVWRRGCRPDYFDCRRGRFREQREPLYYEFGPTWLQMDRLKERLKDKLGIEEVNTKPMNLEAALDPGQDDDDELYPYEQQKLSKSKIKLQQGLCVSRVRKLANADKKVVDGSSVSFVWYSSVPYEFMVQCLRCSERLDMRKVALPKGGIPCSSTTILEHPEEPSPCMACTKCNLHFCGKCNTMWHEDASCEEFQQSRKFMVRPNWKTVMKASSCSQQASSGKKNKLTIKSSECC